MIYIFEDGRILYDKTLLATEEECKYLEFEELPEFEKKEGKVCVIVGCDLTTRELLVEYFDSVVPEPMPEPEPSPTAPTEAEVVQAELLLNQVVILENQVAQDVVLAEILLGQQGVTEGGEINV